MFAFLRKKINIVDAGWLKGMTDIHCHLVPNVDDGSKTLEETVRILQQMQSIGIERVITTPHIYARYPNNNAQTLTQAFDVLQRQLPAGLPELFLAAEYMVDAGYTQHLSDFPLLTLGSSPYLLVEFSFASPPLNHNVLLYEVVRNGAIPLLAHPERFLYFGEDDYDRLKTQGCKFQLNLFSLTGMYGNEVQKRAQWLLKKEMYDFVGTDTHKAEGLRRIATEAFLSDRYEEQLRTLMARNKLLFM